MTERRENDRRVALVLGGGAARGLAHIGVLEVLEREGITVSCIVGSSMGGLIGALGACGLRAREIHEVARGFAFPWWFVPGGFLRWQQVFATATPILARLTFENLQVPLFVTAVDLETGGEIILCSGSVPTAVEATCAVPGVLPPVRWKDRWLVDGGLVNVLPVDVAWLAEPEVVIAVKVGGARQRQVPQLDWRITSWLSRIGGTIPNPATAKVAFEVLVRASEILLERQSMLTSAMTDPEVLIEPDLGNMGLRDFHLLDDAVEAGRRAAEVALPVIRGSLECTPPERSSDVREVVLCVDPVCAMTLNRERARAELEYNGKIFYFCSINCRDCFQRESERYMTNAREVAEVVHRIRAPRRSPK